MMSDEAATNGAAEPSEPKRDLTKAEVRCEMEILAKDVCRHSSKRARVHRRGRQRQVEGIVAEYRNLKRVSLAYARQLGLTPVARKSFKFGVDDSNPLLSAKRPYLRCLSTRRNSSRVGGFIRLCGPGFADRRKRRFRALQRRARSAV